MLTEVHQAPSAESQAMLASLQSAVRKCLERKQRQGLYAIVWQDGQAQRFEWSSTELQGLLSERTFLQRELDSLPAAASLTRASNQARLQNVERQIRELSSE